MRQFRRCEEDLTRNFKLHVTDPRSYTSMKGRYKYKSVIIEGESELENGLLETGLLETAFFRWPFLDGLLETSLLKTAFFRRPFGD